MYNFEALNDKERQEMLSVIGVQSIEELYDCISDSAKMQSLNLDNGCDEKKAQKKLAEISKMNNIDYLNFLGCGAKKRYIPSCISEPR